MGDRIWSRLIKPSTRAFAREARSIPGYSLWDWLHGYIYARWPYLYIGIGTGEHPLSRIVAFLGRGLAWVLPLFRASPAGPGQVTFADTYHGKVLPLEEAKRLVTIHQEIRVENMERVIPYARARDIVLQNPDHIVALECPCRAGRANPCRPLDVCLIVGEPFAGFVAEHHPRRARWITQEQAVEILRAEHERGHVHHAFFKDAMLDRFYAICNCCSCCCGAMQAHQNGIPMLASSGYVARVDAELCAACGTCADYCQFAAISVDDGSARIDAATCMGCGVCVSHCPQDAISLRRDPVKGEPLEVQKLIAQAAVTVQD